MRVLRGWQKCEGRKGRDWMIYPSSALIEETYFLQWLNKDTRSSVRRQYEVTPQLSFRGFTCRLIIVKINRHRDYLHTRGGHYEY